MAHPANARILRYLKISGADECALTSWASVQMPFEGEMAFFEFDEYGDIGPAECFQSKFDSLRDAVDSVDQEIFIYRREIIRQHGPVKRGFAGFHQQATHFY